MTMGDYNYAEAAKRHYADAELLKNDGRLPGADHFYGLAAECALIGIMACRPECARHFGADGSIEGRFRDHVNKIWTEVLRLFQGRKAGGYFSALTSAYRENPFRDWHVLQRYHATAAFASAAVDRHRDAAGKCIAVLERMERDGAKKSAQGAGQPPAGPGSSETKDKGTT
ncbi:hypothetical protein WMF31_38855 [Sorangium sp. So ce1036]|uniref:hypothetical protein n=1 Tax=Sorangium sp. So ce1036 TaxID=3133328 RepID=UPI003F015E8C